MSLGGQTVWERSLGEVKIFHGKSHRERKGKNLWGGITFEAV